MTWLGDDIAAALPELRAHAESMMRTRCIIKPVAGVVSDNDGRDVVTYGPPLYDGCCRVRNRGGVASDAESGSSTLTASRREVHLPWCHTSIPVGAVVFIEGGSRYRITDLADGDDRTAARYMVEVVS